MLLSKAIIQLHTLNDRNKNNNDNICKLYMWKQTIWNMENIVKCIWLWQ